VPRNSSAAACDPALCTAPLRRIDEVASIVQTAYAAAESWTLGKAQTVPDARVPPENRQAHPDTESDSAAPSKRVVLSEELPLTLFIAAVTTVVLSVINTVPELLWIGVLVAPVLADALKNWISEREGWGKRRLLKLTGIIAAGGTAETVVRGRAAASDAAAATAPPAPSASAIVTTSLLSSAITIGTFTAIEAVRDRALLVDRPTTFLSAKPAVEAEPATHRTPAEAIAAWAPADEDYVGSCAQRTPAEFRNHPERRCSDRLGSGDNQGRQYAYRHLSWLDTVPILSLSEQDGRWKVVSCRILVPPGPEEDC
jgi:hypothetical protein